ncbi:MAG: exo-alpha-sialidase [Oscillospiraceae bacterium]|nr:exo-alpha-sialidase [Oscillospiraceae bacterium]
MFIRKNLLKLSALLTAAAMLAACTGGNDGNNGNDGGAATPEGDWSYSQLAMGGGGYVTGVFSTSQEDLYYARTDVGGAYRWDEGQGKWISLSYGVTEENVGMMGIDGLAVDPDEPNKLYLVAGTSYFSNGRTWVLISDDYGDSFEEVEVTDLISASGNGMGRQNGERIAIDPVNNDILYLGGRTGGLIKSTDGGRTWTAVQSLSDAAAVNSGSGVCTVAVDTDSSDGSACLRIFAGISKGGENNVFVSEDGGESWTAVSGLPTNLVPQRMRLDGRGGLIIVYADSEGPWGGSGTGGIMRLNIGSGEVEDISPANRSFGDVAISPDDPDKMVAVTENVWTEQPNGAYGDEFYVTSDGGAAWHCINESMTFTTGEIDWIANAAIHWCGCLAISPFFDSQIKVTSGNGIFACDNIWASAPEFYFDSKGIEETVPMGLATIPGGPIVTAVLDYDGFVNDDPFTYGDVHNSQAGSMTDIAVAYGNADVWVKCGKDGGFWYTLDAGATWQKAKSDPVSGAGGGVVGVSADGSRFFWAPDGSFSLYYTDDNGGSWAQSSGIYVTASIAGDPVNSDYIYASSSGSFYVSSDKGATFTETFTAMSSSMKIAVVPGKEGVLYLPAMGLQKSTDHGQSFTRIDSAAGCLGVGVGKGMSDGQEAVYIWGRPTSDDPMGIYWSTDDGKSWRQVNGDYQFGGMGNGYFIKGDANVCGRCYISTVGLGVVVCSLDS